MIRHPFAQKVADRRIATVAVDDDDAPRAVRGETVEHVSHHGNQRVEAQ